MKCANCGAEVEEGMKFCGECGAPVPQVKKCIKCGAEIPLKMKFCPECGARQDGGAAPSSGGGFAMGDKNVVAGDVIGSKEETHISGNATIIKNEDETKKTAKCHVCGKIILRMEGYECSHCGEFTCPDCYDKITKMCRFCSSSSTSDNEEKYREKLRTILADGKITQEERNELKLLQNRLGISNERAQRIEDAFRNGGNENGLTTAEKLDLENATDLLYGEGKAAEALAIVEPIYERNSSSEEVLNIYIPILAEEDTEKAEKVIDSLQFDCAMAYATSVRLSLAQEKLDNAERKLRAAEKIWPENSILKGLEVWLDTAMWNKYKRNEFLDKANDICGSFAEAKNKLEMTWQVIAQMLVQKIKDEKFGAEFDKAFCDENGIYYALLQKSLTVLPRKITVGKDGDFKTIQEALNAAEDNTVIKVRAGVYNEHLVFNKNVRLIGSEDSILGKSSAELPVVVLDKKSCKIDIPVEIEGIVFTHDGSEKFDRLEDYVKQKLDPNRSSDDDSFTTMFCISCDAKLQNIAVLNSDARGITFSKGEAELKDSVIFLSAWDNICCIEDSAPKIRGCKVLGTSGFSSGINVKGNSSPKISECDVYNNGNDGLLVGGIDIKENAAPDIFGCNIYENLIGIAVKQSASPKISECNIYNNSFGIDADDDDYIFGDDEDKFCVTASLEISNCDIYGNREFGISVEGKSKSKIKNCKIHGNNDKDSNRCTGIYASEDASVDISDCEIYGHDGPGISVSVSTHVKCSGNNIHDNLYNDGPFYHDEK